MDMGQKIYHLRTQKGLTLEELGNMVGVGKSTVRKWENGMIANMKRDKILKVSEALGTSPAYLMGWDEEAQPDASSRSCSRQPEFAPEHTLPYPDFPDSLLADNILSVNTSLLPPKADFCLKAFGNSMSNARIQDGDLVFIHRQDWVENGEIAAVLFDGTTQAVLKRLYYYKEKKLLILKSENSSFEDCIFMDKELQQVHVLGKAIAFQSHIS